MSKVQDLEFEDANQVDKSFGGNINADQHGEYFYEKCHEKFLEIQEKFLSSSEIESETKSYHS